MSRVVFLALGISFVVACGGNEFDSGGSGGSSGSGGSGGAEPADVAGTYNVSITNRENTCGFADWAEGAETTDVGFTINQNGKTVTGTVDGATGLWVEFLVGSRTFSGTVDGNMVHAEIIGTKQHSQGLCSYTVLVVMDSELVGNALQGEVVYTAKTNGNANCGVLETCHARQEFSGSRPPK